MNAKKPATRHLHFSYCTPCAGTKATMSHATQSQRDDYSYEGATPSENSQDFSFLEFNTQGMYQSCSAWAFLN